MSCARGKTRVQYEFGLPDGSTRSFSVEVGPDRVDSGPAEPPPWAALDFHKCPHCPLDVAEEPFCPAAMSIASLAEAVDGLWCHDMVSLKVRTPERFYSFTPVSLQLRGESVATSGDYMQYLTPDMSLHHILDPRTGSSPTHTSGVSVVAPSAMAADALSTASLVLGPREGMELLDRLEGIEGMIVTKDQVVLKSRGLGRFTV